MHYFVLSPPLKRGISCRFQIIVEIRVREFGAVQVSVADKHNF